MSDIRYGVNLDNIDWELLIEQKLHLLHAITYVQINGTEEAYQGLMGILQFIDEIDDKIDAGDCIIQGTEKDE